MKDLAAMFVAAGCGDVQTYIQSGNVIFKTGSAAINALPGLITARIAEQFALRVPVVMRTVVQLGDVINHNPFLAQGDDENMLHVSFLADLPSAERVANLDPDRSPPDEFIVRGQEVYLRLPNGMAETKLTNAYFDSRLAAISTSRNWRTVTKLYAMMQR